MTDIISTGVESGEIFDKYNAELCNRGDYSHGIIKS